MQCPDWSETINLDGLNFNCDWKFLNFATFPNFILRHVLSGQKCHVLSQIFNTTQNFWDVVPNFIHSQVFLGVVKLSSFEPNFQCDSKCLDFAKFQPSQVQSGQIYKFRAKFSTQDWKFFVILPKFILCRSGVVKNLIFEPNLDNVTPNFWVLPNFISFACPEWSKSSILGQIFNTTQNLWILLNFILRRSRALSKISFLRLGFQHCSKFLYFAPNFILLGSRSGQNSQLWAKFSTPLKISRFCQISLFVGPEWSKMLILSQIFKATQNFSGFSQISSFPRSQSGLHSHFLSQIFSCEWKFLDFAKSHPLRVQSGQNSQFWAWFCIEIENFWILPHFILCICPEWSKMSVVNQISDDKSHNVLILQNFILRRSGVVKISIASRIFNATERYLELAIFHPSQVWNGREISIN